MPSTFENSSALNLSMSATGQNSTITTSFPLFLAAELTYLGVIYQLLRYISGTHDKTSMPGICIVPMFF
ncbi:MAG: hypothetical protein LBI36_01025, partial [Oscillospiraceae bacterium]|nr:hypothetical protein [Oscillospiraceae bacterium]